MFVRQKKLSPHKYLETVRIEQAKHFLEEGFSPVQAALKKFCPSVEKLKGSLAEMLWCLILAAASMLLLINGTYNPAIYLNF